MKRTRWFSSQQAPERIGWYEVRFWLPGSRCYSEVMRDYWSGGWWEGFSPHLMCADLKDQWRGLAKKQ